MMSRLLLLLSWSTLIHCENIILPPNNTNATGIPIGLIYIPDTNILPSQYITFCETIQSSFLQPLYVGIVQFVDEVAIYDEFLLLLSPLIQQMERKGLPKNASIFMSGHGFGGNMLQTFTGINQFNYSQIYPFNYKGQILNAAFITHTWRNNNTQLLSNYTIPTLTISGELDGVIRISRIIEQYYIQLISNSTNHSTFVDNQTLLNYPVIIVNGMSHKQFFNGNIPQFILETDLIPEIDDNDARKITAKYIGCWMSLQLNNNVTCSFDVIYNAIIHSNILASPFITAYKLEGSYWFKRPCDCDALICPSKWNCTGGSSWMTLPQQIMCGFGQYGNESIKVTVNNTDAFHPVYQVNPTHYANIWNNCSFTDENCVLNTSTVTQNKYAIEDTEIDNKGDIGIESSSAFEMRHKMKSRQACYEHVNAGFVEEDFTICGQINQYSINWGVQNVPLQTLNRFEIDGEELRIGSDQYVEKGNQWTLNALNYTQECDIETHKYFTAVNSEYLYLETVKNGCKFIETQCGVHYCKVLSPAHYLEWLYIDGLRFNLTLSNSNVTVNTTC